METNLLLLNLGLPQHSAGQDGASCFDFLAAYACPGSALKRLQELSGRQVYAYAHQQGIVHRCLASCTGCSSLQKPRVVSLVHKRLIDIRRTDECHHIAKHRDNKILEHLLTGACFFICQNYCRMKQLTKNLTWKYLPQTKQA